MAPADARLDPAASQDDELAESATSLLKLGVMLYYLLATLYVLACLMLLLVVLLQQGKGGDMASAFGGGGSQTAFGARAGATVLTRATTVLGALFMLGAIVTRHPRPAGAGIDHERRRRPTAGGRPAPVRRAAATATPAPQQQPARRQPRRPSADSRRPNESSTAPGNRIRSQVHLLAKVAELADAPA